jgi:hypothetical protein
MGWTLPKPWENGYVPVDEVVRGGIRQGKVPVQRVWSAESVGPDLIPSSSWLLRSNDTYELVDTTSALITGASNTTGGSVISKAVTLEPGARYALSLYITRLSGALSKVLILRVTSVSDLSLTGETLVNINYGTTAQVVQTVHFTATNASYYAGIGFLAVAGDTQVFNLVRLSLRKVL